MNPIRAALAASLLLLLGAPAGAQIFDVDRSRQLSRQLRARW